LSEYRHFIHLAIISEDDMLTRRLTMAVFAALFAASSSLAMLQNARPAMADQNWNRSSQLQRVDRHVRPDRDDRQWRRDRDDRRARHDRDDRRRDRR
jgi:hypothetical protein